MQSVHSGKSVVLLSGLLMSCLSCTCAHTLARVRTCTSVIAAYFPASQKCDQLTVKLNGMFEECEMLRMESEEAVKDAKLKDRENQRLKLLTGDLGRQVQVRTVGSRKIS